MLGPAPAARGSRLVPPLSEVVLEGDAARVVLSGVARRFGRKKEEGLDMAGTRQR